MESNVFAQFVERRQELRDMLDHFSSIVHAVMKRLCDQVQFIDPVNNRPILRLEHERFDDGSIRVVLFASNERTLAFLFQSNGDARVANALGTNILSDEYIDFNEKAGGDMLLVIEEAEFPLESYVLNWAVNAFEE